MFSEAIVGYLDILGYKDLVTRQMGKEEYVKKLESMFYQTSVGTVEGLANKDLSDIVKGGDKEEERYRQLVKYTKVRNNADNFIFTLPVPKVGLHSSETLASIVTYFLTMTTFVIRFTAQMGYLLRGGISMGNHYESERDRQLFIFSEAHNRAVVLESELADKPRIIVDEHLLLYFDRISFPYSGFFYKDDDYYCMDIYNIFFAFSSGRWDRREEFLTHLENGIELAIEKNLNRAKELDKLIYFAKYHNRKVICAKVNLPHLTLDTEKFEEQLRRLTTA
jgi:hypothetical protein